jgi:hypothetical protein
MKAEKRHQLQRNALADGVGRLLQGMKSGPTKRSTLIWVLVVLALGTIVLWQYGAHATLTQYSELWSEVNKDSHNTSTDLKKLQEFANANQANFPGRTARFEVTRVTLQKGQNELRDFVGRAKAVDSLNDARKWYGKLAGECADAPLLAQEAMMGVAQAEESLVGTPNPDNTAEIFDLTRALESYQRLALKFPDSYLGKIADRRAEEIKNNFTGVEKFYNDLNEWARRRKQDKDGAPSMDLPPPEPVPASPEAAPRGDGKLPVPLSSVPEYNPKTDTITPGTKTGATETAPRPETKAPNVKTESKAPPADAKSKDSKSK